MVKKLGSRIIKIGWSYQVILTFCVDLFCVKWSNRLIFEKLEMKTKKKKSFFLSFFLSSVCSSFSFFPLPSFSCFLYFFLSFFLSFFLQFALYFHSFPYPLSLTSCTSFFLSSASSLFSFTFFLLLNLHFH